MSNQTTSKNIEMCVVDVCNMWIYTFCNSKEEAQEKLQQAIQNNKEDIKTWESHCSTYPDVETFKNYLKAAQNKKYEIMAYDDYVQLERNHYLNKPLTEINEEEYNDMLNVLPPLKWCTKNNIEMFCMSEMLTGTYTSQYLHNKNTNKYYHKIVDIADQSTWGYNSMAN